MTTISNDRMRVDVAPERGAEIRYVGPPAGPNALAFYDWRAPLRASRSSTYGDGVADWLSEYRGGWQELFPNAGAPCELDGVPLPFHGEVSAAAWEVVEADAGRLVLEVPARLPLVLRREMRVLDDTPVLQVRETVVNESDAALAYLWGHHPAFATRPGTHIDLPAGAVYVSGDLDAVHHDLVPGAEARWPEAPLRAGGSARLDEVPGGTLERLCFLPQLSAGWVAMRDVAQRRGVALAWDRATFPHAWLWQQIHGPGLPWFGRAQLTAVEPHSAWPADGLAAHVGRGTAAWLPGGGCHDTWLTVVLFEATERAVRSVGRSGDVDLEEQR